MLRTTITGSLPKPSWLARPDAPLDVMLGVIDVGTDTVESPELVAARIRQALPYVAPEHLSPCTDCGTVLRQCTAARDKMRVRVQGATLVKAGLT